MENTNGTNENRWSEGYRILVRFIKECGLYKEFKIYQKQKKFIIDEKTTDVVDSYASTHFTSFLEIKCHKYPSRHLFTTFIHFLNIFYPSQLDLTQYPFETYLTNGKENCYGIDLNKKKIYTEFNKN